MADTVATLLTQIQDEAGFDVTDAQALRWLNARHRKMIARSRWLRETIAVGVTVANQGSYAIDVDLVEAYELTVGGTAYDRISIDDAMQADAGRLYITNAYYSNADSTGAQKLTIYPTPGTAGDAIVMYAAVLPPDLITSDTPATPADFNDALVEGAIATGMARDIEQVGVADRFEARFDQACEELRRRTNTRLRGSGIQLRVIGVNA